MNRNARRRALNLKRAEPAYVGPVASGNDLAAQNDEPEPQGRVLYEAGTATPQERNLAAAWTGLGEADLELQRQAADVLNDNGKAQRLALRDYNAAVRAEGGSERTGELQP